MTPATRLVLCLLALVVLFLFASTYQQRQSNAAREIAYRELEAREMLVDSVTQHLEKSREELAAVRDSARMAIEDAEQEAAVRMRVARSAESRGDSLSERLMAMLARPALHVFDSIRVAHHTQLDALHGVIAARDRIVGAQRLEISGFISHALAQDSMRAALESSMVARDELITELEREEGFNIFGWRISMKCGGTVAAGLSARGGFDAVAGLGCTVG